MFSHMSLDRLENLLLGLPLDSLLTIGINVGTFELIDLHRSPPRSIACREHTLLVTSTLMEDLEVGPYTIPADELEESFETSGGPGGQHANRSATSVRLRFDIGGSSLPDEVKAKLRSRIGELAEVMAADSRSQFRNRALARRRMQEKIEKALIDPPKRKRTRPTRASKRKRLEEKRARSRTKRLRKPPDLEA